jgi:hypothetical protein
MLRERSPIDWLGQTAACALVLALPAIGDFPRVLLVIGAGRS